MRLPRQRTTGPPRLVPRATTLLAAMLCTFALVGCAAVPQTVIPVPGSYTFATPPDAPVPGGTAVICYHGHSELYIRVSALAVGTLYWTPFSGPARQVWAAYSWEQPEATAPLEPGCGILRVGAYYEGAPYTGPPTITVEITDVPPA